MANTTLQNYSDEVERLSSELVGSKRHNDELLNAVEQKDLNNSKLSGKLHEQECALISAQQQLKEVRLRLQESDTRAIKSQDLVEELQVRCTETMSKFASSQSDLASLCTRLEETKSIQCRIMQL
jgi:hypothetical protein